MEAWSQLVNCKRFQSWPSKVGSVLESTSHFSPFMETWSQLVNYKNGFQSWPSKVGVVLESTFQNFLHPWKPGANLSISKHTFLSWSSRVGVVLESASQFFPYGGVESICRLQKIDSKVHPRRYELFWNLCLNMFPHGPPWRPGVNLSTSKMDSKGGPRR